MRCRRSAIWRTDFKVSRITVRKAIDGLVSEGLLMRRQGSGTFVRARVEKNFSKLSSFSEDMRARGRNPRSVWLRKSSGTVTPEESLTLRASPGTPVYRFHRIRFADDAPMALEYATILAFCLPSVDAVESSLYAALERAGNRPVRALQRLRAVLFTAEQARAAARQGERRGAADRAPRLPARRPRRGVHPVLLPRRHLRLRRRAQCLFVSASESDTHMFREAAQAPQAVRAQLQANAARVAASSARACAGEPPRAVVTCARGSSDHAATFARYLIETRLGLLTSSAAPSVSSVYEARPDLAGTLMLAISQSGASPDLLAAVSERARRRRAHRRAGERRETRRWRSWPMT